MNQQPSRRTRLWFASAIVGAHLLGGCQTPAPPSSGEPVVFVHEDEWISNGGFAALADRRIFALMAFLNAAGYSEEASDQSMHPVRVRTCELLRPRLEQVPEQARRWRAYFAKHRVGLFAYKSFVLALSPDYPFRRVVPDDKLGYPWTAKLFQDLPGILNEFWRTVRLDEVWSEVKPAYLEEIRRYHLAKMEQEMSFLWRYLRMQRRDSQTMVNVPDLLDHHYGAMGAGYGRYYYSVENPGAGSYGLSVHEYLHCVVNPLVQAHYASQAAKLNAYYAQGKDRPAVGSYREPVTFAFECLVRALDRRIRSKLEADPKWTDLGERQVASDTRQGLVLTEPFYRLLQAYEESSRPFDEFVPLLLKNLPEPTDPK